LFNITHVAKQGKIAPLDTSPLVGEVVFLQREAEAKRRGRGTFIDIPILTPKKK
jgi:hypothetical protein